MAKPKEEVESSGSDVAVWNLLHDGSLVGVDGEVPGDVTVTVEIDYLRAMLPEPGNRFLIRLAGCRLFEFRRAAEGRTLISDWVTVSAGEPEILSATLRGGGIIVVSLECGPATYMELLLQYDAASVSIEDGRVVPAAELTAAARRYWAAFASRSE